MNSQKCFYCKQSIRSQPYQCCTPHIYCLMCRNKKCPTCGQSKKKLKVIKCKKCFDMMRCDDAFYDFKNKYGDEYYCVKCMKRAYRDSELTVSVFLPLRSNSYQKTDVIEYLKNFCEKCSTKITNQSQAYMNESSGMLLCKKCSKGKPDKKVSRCSICQTIISSQSIRENDLPICDQCFTKSVHFQKQVTKKIQKSRIKAPEQKKQERKADEQVMEKIEQKQIREIQKKNNSNHKVAKMERKKQQNYQEKEENVDPESIKENVPLSLKNIDGEEYVQCSKCGYQICKNFVIYDEKTEENLCRGCYVVNKSVNSPKKKMSYLREPVEEPKHRNFTKQKPFTLNHHESPKKSSNLSSLYSYDKQYQMPEKYKNLTSTTKKDQDPYYALSGISSLHNKKKCPSCSNPVVFPNSVYCVGCQKDRKKPRY